MAYMNQEQKAKIASELKKVMPADWKYSLSVHHHSTIVLTISAAPVDLIAQMKMNLERGCNHKDYVQVNHYHLDKQFAGELLETFRKIRQALNTDNYDRSDIQTDYFEVGHWVNINIGRWNKPFQVIDKQERQPTYDELKARLAQLEAL